MTPDITTDEQQNLFGSSSWVDLVTKTYGFEIKYLQLPSRAIPFAHIDDIIGKRLISFPFGDYQDVLALNEGLEESLNQLIGEFPGNNIIFKTNLPKDSCDFKDFKVAKQSVYHSIDLKSSDMRTEAFKRGVKKADKSGVTIRIRKDLDSLNRFYTTYKELRFNKFRSIPQPKKFFKNLFDLFIVTGKGYILEAMVRNQSIASMIILIHNDIVYYKYGCSSMEHLNKRPNNALFDFLIVKSRNDGFSYLDLGLSGITESYIGLRRWKESMGGISSPINVLSKKDDNLSDQAKNFKALIGKITDVIVSEQLSEEVTDRFSEELYKYFA